MKPQSGVPCAKHMLATLLCAHSALAASIVTRQAGAGAQPAITFPTAGLMWVCNHQVAVTWVPGSMAPDTPISIALAPVPLDGQVEAYEPLELATATLGDSTATFDLDCDAMELGITQPTPFVVQIVAGDEETAEVIAQSQPFALTNIGFAAPLPGTTLTSGRNVTIKWVAANAGPGVTASIELFGRGAGANTQPTRIAVVGSGAPAAAGQYTFRMPTVNSRTYPTVFARLAIGEDVAVSGDFKVGATRRVVVPRPVATLASGPVSGSVNVNTQPGNVNVNFNGQMPTSGGSAPVSGSVNTQPGNVNVNFNGQVPTSGGSAPVSGSVNINRPATGTGPAPVFVDFNGNLPSGLPIQGNLNVNPAGFVNGQLNVPGFAGSLDADPLGGVVNGVVGGVGNVVGGTIGGVGTVVNGVVGGVTDKVTGVVNGAGQLVGGVLGGVGNLVGGATGGLSTLATGNVVGAAGQIVNGAVGAVGSVVGGVVGAAGSIVNGAVSGVTKAVGGVLNGVAQVAGGVVGGLSRPFGISLNGQAQPGLFSANWSTQNRV